eukprot:CAMPEP_0182912326 /NCGR_PEP_ID=MMETSP0034_2-20130328/37456_1 /TAXON_ID=156128 /ORGANISM="Nephroselmis pyriformis, Strain CCMP717" /LENGTH=87 /DNA_ID=CAMNT_0025048991 /DNA_START=153 /DNA_END=416 /DNA_ORIENTATION=-
MVSFSPKSVPYTHIEEGVLALAALAPPGLVRPAGLIRVLPAPHALAGALGAPRLADGVFGPLFMLPLAAVQEAMEHVMLLTKPLQLP